MKQPTSQMVPKGVVGRVTGHHGRTASRRGVRDDGGEYAGSQDVVQRHAIHLRVVRSHEPGWRTSSIRSFN